MFLIAGIQPKTKTIDTAPRACPQCRRTTAHHKRVDHYFSLFFIPLVRVKKGTPFLFCEACRAPAGTPGGSLPCRSCGKPVDRDFNFCPFCGKGMQ